MSDTTPNEDAQNEDAELVEAHAAKVSPRRAVLDVAVQIVGQVLNLALGLVVTVLIVRHLGATRFGEWSTIFAVSQLVGYFASLGLAGVTVRMIAAEPTREADWVGAYATLTAALTLPVVAIYIVVMQIISRSYEMRVASLILAFGFLTSALSTFGMIFRMRVRNDISVAFVSANSVLWGGAVIVITGRGGGMIPLAFAFVLVMFLIQGSQALLARRMATIRLRGARAMWPGLMRIGFAVGAGTLLTLAYARIDQVLVFELAPHSDEAGIYAAVYRILDTSAFIPVAVMTTLFPIISAAYPANLPRVRRLVQLVMDYLAVFSLPIFAFSLVASEPLLHLLFGPPYEQGANALPVLMAAYVVICFGYVSGNLVITTNLQRRYVNYAIVGLIVNVGFNLVLIPIYGYIAAAWITLLTNLVVIVPAMRSVLRKLGTRIVPWRLLRTAAAAAISGGLVAILQGAGAPFVGLVAAMVISYPPIVFCLRVVDIDELRRVLRQRTA